MKKSLLLLFVSLTATQVSANRTDCDGKQVINIQIEGQKILYRQADSPWRTLGYLNNEDGTRERYTALLTAQATGKSAKVGYPIDNYDCDASNYGTSAYIVRTY